jgi:cytidine deaminase
MKKPIPLIYRKLIAAAKKAKSHSYSPYSKFRVGAALLTQQRQIISGCNIESSSYSLTICAERTAIFKALSVKRFHFKAIAIATDSPEFISPCGACRQVLKDLAGNIDVIMTTRHGDVAIVKLDSLLPFAFTSRQLKRT